MGIELDNEGMEVCGQLLFQNERRYFIDRHATTSPLGEIEGQLPWEIRAILSVASDGRARQQPLRPPLRMHEARRLQGVLPAQEHAVQVLPPVQLALPRLHRGQVRETGVAAVRLQRMQGQEQMHAPQAPLPQRTRRRRTTARSSSSRAGAPTSPRRSCSGSTRSCTA